MLSTADYAVAAVVLSAETPSWVNKLHGHTFQFFMDRWETMRHPIGQAQQDSIGQVVPIMLATGLPVAELREHLGKAVWREIHHATETTNMLRALIWYRYRDVAHWADIVALPEYHLRSCRNAIDWQSGQYAAHNAAPGAFSQLAMLYREAVKLSASPKQAWTVKRLRRERDRLARQAKINAAATKTWAAPFQTTLSGFQFTRLISDRDLMVEGITMRHCAFSFQEVAEKGEVCLFRCEGSDRATLLFGDDDHFELKGFANASVSVACDDAAHQLRRMFPDLLGCH